jgi:maleate isomerase
MLTPSSNTVLEPVASAMVIGLPHVSVHFSRFPVTEISLREHALRQFEHDEIIRAATLLSQARVDVVAWNGTSTGWLGFDTDERLCAALTSATGIPACTSVLALNEILALTGAKSVAFVTPYRDDVQQMITRNYERAGFQVVAEQHLGLEENFSFSTVTAERLREMARRLATVGPDAIAIFCTNLRGAPLVEELEAETKIPIYDTVATAVWKSLRIAGVDVRRVTGWGSLFRVNPPLPIHHRPVR